MTFYQCSGSASVGIVCFWASRIRVPYSEVPYQNDTDPHHCYVEA